MLLAAFIAFSVGYALNVIYITVFYHRGLAHKSLDLHPALQKWIAVTGPWITGIDPKGWIAMHRMHHAHSDTPKDPHSPVHQGVFGVAIGQLRSYERALVGLLRKEPAYVSLVKDLPFGVHWLNARKRWTIPYFVHLAISIALGFAFGHWLVGIAYYVGIMTHPVQGWMVNSLAHRFGYRNYDIDDNSKNNHLVSWLVVGEGYQNNHHAFPNSANFAMKPGEIDMGYWLCRATVALGLARLPQRQSS